MRWTTHPTLRSPSKEIGYSWRWASPTQRRGILIKKLLFFRRCSGQRMWLWTLASLSGSVLLCGASVAIALCRDLVGFLLEHPEDPQRYRKQTREVQSCPSLWRTIMPKEFRDTFSLGDELHLDQGPLGHITVKLTTLGTNLSGIMGLQGLRVDPVEFKGSKDVPSHTLAQWAPQVSHHGSGCIGV